MERDEGDIEDSGAVVGGTGEMDDDAYELIEALEANKRSDKDYVWAKEPADGSAGLKPGNTVVFLFEWGWERGIVHSMNKCSKHQKEIAEEATLPVLVRHVIDGDYILQDFGEDGFFLTYRKTSLIRWLQVRRRPTWASTLTLGVL